MDRLGTPSALEREITSRAAAAGAWLRQRDRGMLLSVLLCFAPLPPANLLGLVLAAANLMFVRRGSLPKADIKLLWVGIGCAIAYNLFWLSVFVWLFRTGTINEGFQAVRAYILWLLQPLHWPIRSVEPPSLIQRVGW